MAGRAKAFRGWRMFSKCPRRRLSHFTLSSTRYEGARFPFRQRDEGQHRGRAHARPPDFTGSAVALARAGGARGASVGDAASDLRPPFPRQFLLIFHKAAAGELQEESGLMALAKLSEIDVALEGVRGAKDFFEAKVQALSSASKFEAELKAEQEERKQEEEKRRIRQAAFRELKAAFST